MHLRHLSLGDFRSWRSLELPFAEGHHLLVGRNGSGKTNLLEAIHVLGTGASMRSTRDAVLAAHGAPGFRAAGRFEAADGAGRRVEVLWDARGGKRILLDKEAARASDLLDAVKVVSFAPSDVELVQDGGRVRRRFLDLLGCQLSRECLRLLREYQRALKQRNETLTRAFVHARGRTGASIAREPWTERVATLGSDLCVRRAALVDSLRDAVRELARDAFPKAGDVDVEYAPAVPWEDGQAGPALAAALEQAAGKDEVLGYTTVGPHADDMELRLGGRELRRFGSLGQQQLAAMFLKLAQADLVRRTVGATPLLLVDEMFAILDRPAAEEFLRRVEGEGQIFLATAQESWLGELRERRFHVHRVEPGEIRGEAGAVRGAAAPP
jgi:DNA replication and repair protein RecF